MSLFQKIGFDKKKISREKSGYISLLAFTLAEVLITIGIIGIVAEVTIPTLVSSFKKQTTISQLKKEYAMLQTMNQAILANNGPMITWGWDLTQEGDDARLLQFFNEIIAPNLRVTMVSANTNDPDDPCFPQGKDLQGNVWNLYGGTCTVLADGSSMLLQYWRNVSYDMSYIWFTVDLNGSKGPNAMGRDRFMFTMSNTITGDKIEPFGAGYYYPPDEAACYNESAYAGSAGMWAGNGVFCAYSIIMYDNWQIVDDYKL